MSSDLEKNSYTNNINNLPNNFIDDFSSKRNSKYILPDDKINNNCDKNSKNNSININNNNNNSLSPKKNDNANASSNYISNITNNSNLSSATVKKFKQLENILNQKSININEIRSITWKGLPFGKF